MKETFHRAWQHILVTGLCSLAFGTISLLWPAIPLYTFEWLFAIFMVAEGIFIITGAWRTRFDNEKWWLLLFYGVLCTITGVVTAVYPGLTTLVLGFIISMHLLVAGFILVYMAIHLRREIRGEGWLILSGFIAMAIGVWLLIVPGGGALAMLWLIAVTAIALGILFILLAIKARSWRRRMIEA